MRSATTDERMDERETLPISVCITTKDNADIIRRCLESVHDWTDEIVVVDSDSRDGTIEICEEYGASVYQHEFKGFGDIKTKSIAHATNDWVLILDSDEEVPPALRREIFDVFGSTGIVGFYIRKREHILGAWSHQYHVKQPVLARKEALYYQQEHLWERPAIRDEYAERTRDLEHALNNYTVDRVSERETKMMQYSALEALQIVELDKRDGAAVLLAKGIGAALYRLVVGRAVLDGYRGFYMAFTDVNHYVTTYAKIRDIERLRNRRPEDWKEIWLEEECGR
ncbi:glycosyltransferase family 2 protein [Natronorubrum texcoconense]|uniref:Glycosyltransferase involved in cell wall bisynthesis n=1 Tax=Natronorubrum texcoconense TaxID=1095776 RepID=A0A1G9E832_9EURY|nr:glycosyltransferase family 2 protein [Natronorubrum texcoconense]SDK72268.1 Glycosyltransferase involved in cell wall bisynthesis [Natronorubrum texcoconense]